jgi:hypothetical protein
LIKEAFPWQKMHEGCPKKMRFAIQAAEKTFWLDLKEDESVPFFSKDSVLLKLWE